MQQFKLGEGRDPMTYGLGLKEVWEFDRPNFDAGSVLHSVGWPLNRNTYGGGFLYTQSNKAHLGFVVGLDYSNPYLDPYQEFQRWKTHPQIK